MKGVPFPMLRRHLLLVASIALMGVAVAQTPMQYPQRQRPSQTGTLTLSGTVVNSVTGEPIPRALIQLSGMTSRAALTDSEGRFQFDNLPETQAVLMAHKPGYFSDLEMQRGSRPKRVVITANMGSVTVSLTPAGVVSGHVSSSDGEPVEFARVRLRMKTVQNGRRQWMDRSGATTDDDGYFRIGNLQPGAYYLYCDALRTFSAGDEALAPAYYPGVSDISGASPLEIRPGNTAVADIMLRKDRAYRVTGIITGLEQGQNASVQLIGSGGESLPLQSNVSQSSGTFELRRVPPGSYTLKVHAQQRVAPGMINGIVGGTIGGFPGGGRGPRMPQTYTGSVPITVNGDLSGVTVAVQPSITIPIEVRTEFTNKQTEPAETTFRVRGGPQRQYQQYVMLHLVRTDGQPGDNYAQMTGAPDNVSFFLQNVEPGRYRVEFMQVSNTYVKSATYGTTDLLREDLIVTGGTTEPIEVVVRDDGAFLSGTANCSDTQCWVFVVPEGTSAFQPRTIFVSPQGTFQQGGLAPGAYRVYAFDRVDGIEYTNPEAMKAYGARAQTVVLSAGQRAQVNVDLTKVVDQ